MNATDPSVQLMRLINGFQVTQAIHVVATLGIADLLKDKSRSSDELAQLTQTHPAALFRLLRALAAVGLFTELPGKCFELTPVGDCLRAGGTPSYKAWAQYVGRPYVWQSWGALSHTIGSGETAFDHLHGSGIWEWRAKQPVENEIFDAAMTGMSRALIRAIVAAYDFSKFQCVVDVGGGQGALLAGILAANPGLQGILFDLPHVVAGAPAVVNAAGVSDRCRIVGGDVFQGPPEGGDAYIVKAVLMDEEDSNAVAILAACKRAMKPSAKLIVIERGIAAPNQGPENKFSDLTMMVMTGGRERTQTEFASLFATAGFDLKQQISTPSGTNLLVGDPI